MLSNDLPPERNTDMAGYTPHSSSESNTIATNLPTNAELSPPERDTGATDSATIVRFRHMYHRTSNL
jgi:hypothetical protein